jgi:F0F1-type ATP synthase epsilon subunit
MYNHGAIISSLTEGKIKYLIDKEISIIEVVGGFAEVKNNVVTVCLETIIK